MSGVGLSIRAKKQPPRFANGARRLLRLIPRMVFSEPRNDKRAIINFPLSQTHSTPALSTDALPRF